MNYLVIIVILAIIALYIFFSKEIDTVKKDIDDKLTHISTSLNSATKIFQSDLGACVKKIKAINGEYVEQVRKMNDYGSQPITNISNHYTDCDSGDGQNPINYLSDTNTRNNSKKEQSFYMSEDNNKFKIKYSDKSDKNNEPGLKSSSSSPDVSEKITESKESSESSQPPQSPKSQDVVDVDNENKPESEESEDSEDLESSEYSKLSAATIDIKRLSSTTLKPLEKCTYEYLKKISKIYAIPLRVSDGKKTRQLKKDELYQKIKSYLEEHK